MATINRLAHRRSFTISKLYSKYSEIKENHVLSLLEFLYKDKNDWFNPITKKFINRGSDIIISFLSKGYYVYGDREIIINGEKLPYKEHIERFIDNKLLINVRHLKRSPSASPKKASPTSPMGAATNKPRSNSPPKIGIAPAVQAVPTSPMGAATNKPKTPPAAAPVANSRKPIQFSSKSKGRDKNAEKLDEELCLSFVKHIKEKIQNTKTSAELKELNFENPVTGHEIGIASPILRSFLSKCYYAFNDKEIKDIIEEITDVSNLIETEKVIPATPIVNDVDVALKIGEAIDNAINDFYKCCDKLEANCNANGILTAHRLIANVVNSIMTIIHIRYMHLNKLYSKIAIKDKQPLQIYMYDEEINQTKFTKTNLTPTELFIYYYKTNRIMYQKTDLLVENVRTDLNPDTIDTYYINTLFNRQYVFEYLAEPILLNGVVITKMLLFNKINQKILPDTKYPASLDAAIETLTSNPYNYNITNSALPKYVFTNNNDISKYFKDIIDLVNLRLKTLPDVKGVAKEITFKEDYYDDVIGLMMKLSYGNNETGYGKINMIRKNILYSLNAQNERYIINNSPLVYKDIFYNSEFTGTFPLFTWIPLKNGDKTTYNYPRHNLWQPFEIDPNDLLQIEENYKNHNIPPWSKGLNDAIFKVITDEYVSIYSLTNKAVIQNIQSRVMNTIGYYKDKTMNPAYKNKKIYLYHGTKTRLHNIKDAYYEDIEILGFLSTSLNMYTASQYSGVAVNNAGLIYIIEVDETHTYINLNDQLQQFLLLPNSRFRVLLEFNYGKIRVVMCRLIRTPTIKINNLLYNKLLAAHTPNNSNLYINYRIKNNNNQMPVCAFMLSKFWKKIGENGNEGIEAFRIRRDKLNNKEINNITMSKKSFGEQYLYFSLGQENDLYVDRGVRLIFGSFEDIKYSIHQHFIKDCYKAIGIPCLDYIFIHSAFVDNAISTGILLDDYVNNRTHKYKYDVNNFLIDCIFKFDSIPNENKELDILDDSSGKYVDKIEGFRDACMYRNGVINPLFNNDALSGGVEIGEHIQYIRNWKHIFAKYNDATDDDLKKHFIWCNNRIVKLIEIIKATKVHYFMFITDTLNGRIEGRGFDKKGFIEKLSKEALELTEMIETLAGTLVKRATFYKRSTSPALTSHFIELIRVILSDEHNNTHNSKLYRNPILKDLILEEKNDVVVGGILSALDMNKQGARIKSDSNKVINHQKIYEAYKNIPIDSSKDMRKFKDMPKSFQEYYNGAILDKDGCFDISDHCYCRPVKRG
jgi:hypothetical protein